MSWIGPTLRSAVKNDNLGIALTGAKSWLGQALLATLSAENALPSPARLRLFGSVEQTTRIGGKSHLVEKLTGAVPLSGGPWLLLHFAFLGKERTNDLPAKDFVAANNGILRDVCRLAEVTDSLRLVFSSSGAVYGADADRAGKSSSNPYGWCKADHEGKLTAWCAERGAPLVIPRIFNIGGPFINKIGSYALSSFIESAQTRSAIRIEARQPTYRSYVHVDELLNIVLDAALCQMTGAPLIFDTAGKDVVEMADLAAAVCKTLDLSNATIERAPFSNGAADRYIGNGACYRSLLAQHGRDLTSLERIIADTAGFLQTSASSRASAG